MYIIDIARERTRRNEKDKSKRAIKKGEFMEKEEMTLSKAVCKALDSFPSGFQFYGRELQKEASRYYPKASSKYTDTILRVARKLRRRYSL